MPKLRTLPRSAEFSLRGLLMAAKGQTTITQLIEKTGFSRYLITGILEHPNSASISDLAIVCKALDIKIDEFRTAISW